MNLSWAIITKHLTVWTWDRIYYLTAYRNFTYAYRALGNQVLAYLLKPVKKKNIERVLPKLLDNISKKNRLGIPTYELNYSENCKIFFSGSVNPIPPKNVVL